MLAFSLLSSLSSSYPEVSWDEEHLLAVSMSMTKPLPILMVASSKCVREESIALIV